MWSGWGDPDAGGQPSGIGASLTSGVVKVCTLTLKKEFLAGVLRGCEGLLGVLQRTK